MLERQPLEALTRKNLVAFKHHGFWQCMDTLRDYNLPNKMNTINAPWKNKNLITGCNGFLGYEIYKFLSKKIL